MGAYDTGDSPAAWSEERRDEAIRGMLAMAGEYVVSIADHGIVEDYRRSDRELEMRILYRRKHVTVRVLADWSEDTGLFEFLVSAGPVRHTVLVDAPYAMWAVFERVYTAASAAAELIRRAGGGYNDV